MLIYNAAENNSRKINKLFRINSAGAGVVKYNNKISAHTRRLINYFKIMYTKMSVFSGHYIISAYIISNN